MITYSFRSAAFAFSHARAFWSGFFYFYFLKELRNYDEHAHYL